MRRFPAKAWIVMCVLSVAIIVLGQKLGHRDGLLLSVAIALSINCLMFFYGDLRLVPLLRVNRIEGQDPWGVLRRVQQLSAKAHVPAPQVYVIPHATPQTLAVGRSLSSGKIFLTEGLLNEFTPQELDAVLAYNLALIKNLSTLSFTVASALADAVLTVGRTIDGVVRWVVGGKRKSITSVYVGTLTVAPLAAALIHLAVGHREYLRADQLAASLIDDPHALAGVLWKLQSYAYTQPLDVNPATSHFFIVNPLTKPGWSRYFHAQPSVKERISRLIGYYPI